MTYVTEQVTEGCSWSLGQPLKSPEFPVPMGHKMKRTVIQARDKYRANSKIPVKTVPLPQKPVKFNIWAEVRFV